MQARRGVIKGGTLVMLQGLVSLLRNPDALLEHGQTILDGRKRARDVLGSFLHDMPVVANVADFIGEEEKADSQDDSLPPPMTSPSPAIEIHGLW